MPKKRRAEQAQDVERLEKLNERLDQVRALVEQFKRDLDRIATSKIEEEARVAEAAKKELDQKRHKKLRRDFLCFMAKQHGISLPTGVSPVPSREPTPELKLALT